MAQHTIDLPCIADTYIDSIAANTNNGTITGNPWNVLEAGYTLSHPYPIYQIILLRFNTSSIPLGKKVVNIALRVYVTQGYSGIDIMSGDHENWVETSSTWNTLGGITSGFSTIASNVSYPAAGYYEIPMPSDKIAYLLSPNRNAQPSLSLTIHYPDDHRPNPSFEIQSRENTNPPMLRVTYEDVPPDAPTPREPISLYKDINSPIHFEWTYNSSVGGAQTKYDLQWSIDQTNWTTITQTTADNFYDMPANTFVAGNVYWRVRCYNEYDEAGPYCSTQSFYAVGAPLSPIINTVPTDTARPVISWSAFGQQIYQLQVTAGDIVVHDTGNQPSINARQHKITAFLGDGSYTLKLRIKNAFDLWSVWSETTFTLTTTKPEKPILTAQKSDYGISLNIDYTADYVLIYRDGICIGKTNMDSYTDNAVINRTEHTYIARAVLTNTEAYEDSDPVTTTAVFTGALIAPISDINNVFAFTMSLNTPPKRVYDHSPGGTFRQYAGRRYPVWEPDEHMSAGLACTFFLQTLAEVEAFEAIYDLNDTVLYRDARSRKIYGNLTNLQTTEDRAGYIISFVINETDYSEEIEV